MAYSRSFVEALQLVWGEGFLSPGGPREVAALLDGVPVRGRQVLDIGSGLGGIDLLLVEAHGAAEVIGIDVEPLLVDSARALVAGRGLEQRISFRLVEPGPLPFGDESFDLVVSKDAIVHVPDKAALYREVLRVLRAGGRFAASDWLFGPGAEDSAAMKAWLAELPLSFAFITPEEAGAQLERAGFEAVSVIDRSAVIRELNRKEVASLTGPLAQQLAARLGPEMAEGRVKSARGRQLVLESGDLRPSHLKGRKPG